MYIFFIASFHKMLSGFMGSDNGNFIDLFLLILRHKLLSAHFKICFINSRKKLKERDFKIFFINSGMELKSFLLILEWS